MREGGEGGGEWGRWGREGEGRGGRGRVRREKRFVKLQAGAVNVHICTCTPIPPLTHPPLHSHILPSTHTPSPPPAVHLSRPD